MPQQKEDEEMDRAAVEAGMLVWVRMPKGNWLMGRVVQAPVKAKAKVDFYPFADGVISGYGWRRPEELEPRDPEMGGKDRPDLGNAENTPPQPPRPQGERNPPPNPPVDGGRAAASVPHSTNGEEDEGEEALTVDPERWSPEALMARDALVEIAAGNGEGAAERADRALNEMALTSEELPELEAVRALKRIALGDGPGAVEAAREAAALLWPEEEVEAAVEA